MPVSRCLHTTRPSLARMHSDSLSLTRSFRFQGVSVRPAAAPPSMMGLTAIGATPRTTAANTLSCTGTMTIAYTQTQQISRNSGTSLQISVPCSREFHLNKHCCTDLVSNVPLCNAEWPLYNAECASLCSFEQKDAYFEKQITKDTKHGAYASQSVILTESSQTSFWDFKGPTRTSHSPYLSQPVP